MHCCGKKLLILKAGNSNKEKFKSSKAPKVHIFQALLKDFWTDLLGPKTSLVLSSPFRSKSSKTPNIYGQSVVVAKIFNWWVGLFYDNVCSLNFWILIKKSEFNPKLEAHQNSTIFAQSLWNFVKIITSEVMKFMGWWLTPP